MLLSLTLEFLVHRMISWNDTSFDWLLTNNAPKKFLLIHLRKPIKILLLLSCFFHCPQNETLIA